MDDSVVRIGEVHMVGETQDLGLSRSRIKPRGFKVASKVNHGKSSKFVSCPCHLKCHKRASDQEHNNPSIQCHAIFMFLDPILLAVLQVEYQSKESPFDKYPVLMQTFLVAICIYGSVLGIKIQNNNKHARCDQILIFVLLVSGSVSSGALFSTLLHGFLLWLVLIILGTATIILGRHLLKNSMDWILGSVAILDLIIRSKFSTMVSIFHKKAPAQGNNINQTEGVEGV